MTIEELLAELDSVRKSGNGYTALCPAHKDTNPSLSISKGENGKILLHCYAGCETEQIVAALGFTLADFYPGDGLPPAGRRVVATYDYRDESSVLLYQVVRCENKEFRQRQPDGRGGWSWNLKGVRRVLYRLPEIADKDTVYVPEGEKDADRLWSLGLPATCNPSGAGKWRDEYSESLRDKHVVILPDNDQPGEKHAQQVARSVLPHAAAVKIVRLPGLPPKSDISDWLDAGHTKDELLELIDATPAWRTEESVARKSEPILRRASDVKTRRLKWLWPSRIPLGKLTVIDGDPGLGKSLLTLDLSARVSRNWTLPDGSKSDLDQPAGVVLLSAEDDPADTIVPRLEAAGADLEKIQLLDGILENDEERGYHLGDIKALRQAIEESDAKLVVIDPLFSHLPEKTNAHKDDNIRRDLAPLAKLAAELNVAIVVIRHLTKGDGRNPLYRGGGSIGIIGAVRSALLIAKDPENEDRRILAVSKSNLAQLAPSLAYYVKATNEEIPYLSWDKNSSTHTAASLLAQPVDGEERSTLDEAKDFLREVLSEGAMPTKEVQKQARDAGISERTLDRAKAGLGIKARKQGGFFSKNGTAIQQWCWQLPATEGCQTSENGTLQQPDGTLQQHQKSTWEDDL